MVRGTFTWKYKEKGFRGKKKGCLKRGMVLGQGYIYMERVLAEVVLKQGWCFTRHSTAHGVCVRVCACMCVCTRACVHVCVCVVRAYVRT